MEIFRGLRAEYWCSHMATHGCGDPRVTLWLKAEYAAFKDRDGPSQVDAQRVLPSLLLRFVLWPSFPSPQICDSGGVQHPSYCTFKSHQCLQHSLYNQKVRSSPHCPLHSCLLHSWSLHSQPQIPAGFTGPLLATLVGHTWVYFRGDKS